MRDLYGPDLEYSEQEMEAMLDASIDDEEYRETHHVEHGFGELPCGGELRATENGDIVCHECGFTVRSFAPTTWEDAA